jgi:hypothetical protein
MGGGLTLRCGQIGPKGRHCCAQSTHHCWEHRVIMYFIESKAKSRLPYFGHLPLNTYLSLVYKAAMATELGGIQIY